MSDLSPCPFCGSTNISSGEVLSGQSGDYAKQTACLDCGATGPEVKMSLAMCHHADGDALADAAWNRRPSQSELLQAAKAVAFSNGFDAALPDKLEALRVAVRQETGA